MAKVDSSGRRPTSRWSVILRAQGSGGEATKAFDELIRRYQGFIVRMIRYFRHPPDLTPDDLKNDFIIWLLAGGIKKFDRNRRTFRGWLSSRIRGFLSDEWDKWRRRDRTRAQSFDIAHHDDPERFCDVAFAWETLVDVLARLRAEATDPRRFEALQRFLPGPQLDLVPYAPVAKALGVTPLRVAGLVWELKAEFKRLLYESVADSLGPISDSDSDPTLALDSYPTREDVEREMCLFYRTLSETPCLDVLLEDP